MVTYLIMGHERRVDSLRVTWAGPGRVMRTPFSAESFIRRRFVGAVSAIRSWATARRTLADLVVRRGCETDEARGRIGEGFERGDRDGRI